jgi:hypothetical protein
MERFSPEGHFASFCRSFSRSRLFRLGRIPRPDEGSSPLADYAQPFENPDTKPHFPKAAVAQENPPEDLRPFLRSYPGRPCASDLTAVRAEKDLWIVLSNSMICHSFQGVGIFMLDQMQSIIDTFFTKRHPILKQTGVMNACISS